MKTYLMTIALTCFTSLISINHASSQDHLLKVHDYLMPQKGKSLAEFYTGLPYVAIGQYSYGFSDRFSVGVIYGFTPFVRGMGLRIKAIIGTPTNRMRIYFKSPLIYYPKAKEEKLDPWFLVWPTINVEWKLKNEGKIWVGAGVIGAACADVIFNPKERHKNMSADEMQKMEKMTDLWNTLQIGYSKPISNKLSFVIEIAPVLKGLKIKSHDGFLDGAPVIFTTGLSYSF